MELAEWIDSVGGPAAAAQRLKVKQRTVEAWYRMEKSPRLASAVNIVVRSHGAVDYNGIYGPIARMRAAA